MRSLLSTILLLTASLSTHATPGNASPIQIETYSASCAGEANGSFSGHSATANWTLGVYYNGTLINSIAVAGCDTVVHGYRSGCYTFAYTANDGASASVSTVLSAPDQIISLCRVHYLDRENMVSFINLSAGAVKFDWDFGDGGEHSAEISPVHAYSTPGTYTVTLTAYNLNGCSSVSTYTVVVASAQETGIYVAPARPAQEQMEAPIRTIVH
jgi:PKD repeat protein